MENILNLPIWSSSEDDSDDDFRAPKRQKIFRVQTNFFTLEGGDFKERFRLRRDEVEFVLEHIGGYLLHPSTKNRALSPAHQLLTTLHWLGTGSQYHSIGDMHGISKATVCRVIRRVVNTVVNNMFQTVVSWPENVDNIPLDFFRKGGFPSVCGCVDGSLIPIDAPSLNEASYVDRHGDHSLNIMFITGADLTIFYCSARWPGAVHDSRVLRNSTIQDRFEEGWRPFPGAVLLGDSGYAMKDWLITPYYRNLDNPVEQRFNRAHKATRRLVENVYGIIKERFPCLNHMRLDPAFVGRIVMACSVFHNIATKDDFVYINNQEDLEEVVVNENVGVGRVDELLAFFI